MRTSDTIGRHRRDPAAGLEHSALFYGDDDAFLAGVLDHVHAGFEADDVVVVGLPPEHLTVLRAELGDDAGRVHLHDLSLLARNPARLLPALRMFVDGHGSAEQRVRAVAETCWSGRTPAERVVCVQHDALSNVAFENMGLSVLCAYDTRELGEDERADACAAHQHNLEDGAFTPNPNYSDPVKLAAALAGPLTEPAGLGETLVFTAPHGPRTVRLAVAEHARRAGLTDGRVADLCLAVHEVAVNTVVHTDGPGILSLWEEDGAVVAEIQDGGYVADPLAGSYPPGPTDGRGYGLYLTHRLCDLVQIHTTLDAGTTVRMSMRLASS